MNLLPHRLTAAGPRSLLRPTREECIGINWKSPQAVGLKAWYPLWDMNGYHQERVAGTVSTIVGAAMKPEFDPIFGTVAKGPGDGSGGGPVNGIRFPNLPHTNVGNFVPDPWAYSFWFRSLDTTGSPNEYMLSYNQWGASPWPGTAISFDTSNQLACNTNGSTLPDASFKTVMNPWDMKWHHCLFVQIPSGTPNVYNSTNIYYIDGALDGSSAGCVQAAACPGGTDMYLNGSDSGDANWSGRTMDFRIYRGLKDLGFARHLYHHQTRWDLYLRRPIFDLGKQGVPPSAVLTGTAADGMTEAEVVAGGQTIVVTLTGDTFIAN